MQEKKIPRAGEQATHLTLYIGTSKSPMVVRMKSDGIILGRNSKNTTVDVNLKPFDAIQKGVSRKHVLIAPKRDYFYVKDLESVNSTWHNRVRMKPNVAEELFHEDVLHLGELRVEVHYTYADEVKSQLGNTVNFGDADNQQPAGTVVFDQPDEQATTNKGTIVFDEADLARGQKTGLLDASRLEEFEKNQKDKNNDKP
ncbi:MAG: FHA domain-containing protein [Chloroflexota bacterium]